MRQWTRVAIIAAIALASVAHADQIRDWAELQTALEKADSNPTQSFNVERFHTVSKSILAMFEAANAIDRRYVSYVGVPAAAPGPSPEAAVVAAAHDALLAFYPGSKVQIENAYAMGLAGIAAGPGRGAGVAVGQKAAAAALKAGGRDPAAPKGVQRPNGGAFQWVPGFIPFPPEIVTFKPWFMASPSAERPPPPLSLNSKAWADAFNEVKARGSKTSTVRTAAETGRVRFWMGYDADPLLRQIASQLGRSHIRNARLYALIAIAGDDQSIAMANGKMHYMFWRPMNAIRSADLDGNDATAADVTWEPIIFTAIHPEYPCGHCSWAGVVGSIVADDGSLARLQSASGPLIKGKPATIR